jgi:quercetin dioxygenase-like cupin family protein
MNNQAKNKADFEDQEQSEVFGLLSEHLKLTPQSQTVLDSLEKRLENRSQSSIAKHAGLRTVRSREGVWQNLVSGIRYKPLWGSPQGNSVLVEFSPGSSLPLHRHNYLEEGIVLSGGLQLDELELTQFDYHVSPAGSRHGHISSTQGGLAYLRGSSLGQHLSMFKEILGGLLSIDHQESESIMDNESGWIEIQKGVCQKDLWTDGKVVSRYFRMEVDTRIDGYDHPLDEECMVLSGDIFIGDILLQEGDYILAPAGIGPLDIFSDTGALFFLRGAVQTPK